METSQAGGDSDDNSIPDDDDEESDVVSICTSIMQILVMYLNNANSCYVP